jgi:hypothetical protein
VPEKKAPEVRHMSQSYARNLVHLIFSTKNRGKFVSVDLRPRLWSYMGGVCKNSGVIVHEIGGTEDSCAFVDSGSGDNFVGEGGGDDQGEFVEMGA